MSKVHFIIGLVSVIALVVVGGAIGLVSVGEAVVIGILVLLASPFIFKFVQLTRKHDER
jgi:ammonia channel protein AmtB